MDLNLRVIQRYDPFAICVISVLSHVSAHALVDGEWRSLNYEGPFIFYKRVKDSHGFVLMNRRAWKNLLGRVTPTQSLHPSPLERVLIYSDEKTGMLDLCDNYRTSNRTLFPLCFK